MRETMEDEVAWSESEESTERAKLDGTKPKRFFNLAVAICVI
jgi:hypothetical protein